MFYISTPIHNDFQCYKIEQHCEYHNVNALMKLTLVHQFKNVTLRSLADYC